MSMTQTVEPVTVAPHPITAAVTFVPDPAVALGQKLMFGLIGLVAAGGFHYYKTRRALEAFGIGAAVAVVMTIVLVLKGRKRGMPNLTLNPDNLTIEDNLHRTVVPWDEIKKATHYLHGEDRWEFHVESRREPIRYPLYGFLQPQLSAIKAALLQRLPCEEERTPMEGPRPLRA